MKALAAAFGVGALFGGLQTVHDAGTETAAAAGQAHVPGTYRLVANGGDTACMVKRGAHLSEGLSELVVGVGCRAVLPGIEQARFWRERKDGTVGFSVNGADPLVSFAVGDGVDYESYAPALPLLTMVAE